MFLAHLKKEYFTIAYQFSETLMRLKKELHFLNYCSHKINKFLIQNIDLYNIHKKSCCLLGQFFQYLYCRCQAAVKKLNVILSRAITAKFILIYF